MVIGAFHLCVMLYDRNIECAGFNNHGQLWQGWTSQGSGVLLPAVVLPGTPIRSFSCGSFFSCAAPSTGDNKVYCVGRGDSNYLGDGNFDYTVVTEIEPLLVKGLQQAPRIAQLATADQATCVLYSAPGSPSSVQCWGFYYREANNSTTVTMTGVDNATMVVMSTVGEAGCVLLQDETVACWVGSVRAERVRGLSNAVRVVMGYATACAVVKSQGVPGSLWCWLTRAQFMAERPSLVSRSIKPQLVQGLPGSVLDAVAGYDHVCALVQVSIDLGGEVYCWGDNMYAQLGQGYTNGTWDKRAGSTTPLRVDGLSNVIALYGGHHATCAETATHRVYCWGQNAAGMLGTGLDSSFVMRPAPMQKLCA
jgi:hypothetical protein